MKIALALTIVASLCSALPVHADDNTVQLGEIVVTPTRIPEPAFNIPASVSVVPLGTFTADTPGINASEYLQDVPGVLARDRQNYAQDEQISIRGFGSRSTFGVRGVRLYTDGIPATMPDGQGQVSSFDFGSADRIEVLRGPFSALYGNSSGGVIEIFTADGDGPPEVLGSLDTGSFNARHLDLGVRGGRGGFGYNFDLSDFRTDGFRDHSRAQRINGNAKLDFAIGKSGKLTVLLNTVSLPEAQDPQGLTRQQFEANPAQAAPSALTYNTRKSVHQTQAGVVYTQTLDEHQSLRFMTYNGERSVQQLLSVPVAAQASPTSSGGVVNLATIYGDGDARWLWQGALAGRSLDFTAGLAYDWENQHRLGYNNFAGTTLGVVGALRRNEQDDVYNFDQYLQASWQFSRRWSLMAGARHSAVNFQSDDQYITAMNPDDSGRVRYGNTSPVAGLMYDVNQHWHLYAAYGEGFETPTFSELGYRPDGESGLNFGLQPARSQNGEVGSKWRFENGARLDVAFFDANTRDELAVLSSAGGRTIYQNIGRAERRGAELGLHLPLARAWQFDVAYTYLQARILDAFSTCPTVDACSVPAGTSMPGVPRNLLHAALSLIGGSGWHVAFAVDAAGPVGANDAATLVAPGYAIAGINAGYVTRTARYEIAPFLRVDNLLNHRYIGSVIVNQSSGGSFEPAPGRTFWLGVNVRFRSAG